MAKGEAAAWGLANEPHSQALHGSQHYVINLSTDQ